MASGPHNGATTSFPAIPFSQFKTEHMLPPPGITSTNSMPRLVAPPPLQADALFIRPPHVVTSMAGPTPTDAPPLLSNLMPPLGLLNPNQFDPSSAAACAAAAAVQAASLKMAGGRTQSMSMTYDKIMSNMFFPRSELTHGVPPPPPPPLGVRPPTAGMVVPSSLGGGQEPTLFPPVPGCASSPFAGCASGKLPSPVLPHSASRLAPSLASKGDHRQNDKDDFEVSGEKKVKEEFVDGMNEESNTGSEESNSAGGDSSAKSNNNNNCSMAKMVSKGIEFSYDGKSQTETEVQKLMSIALSNNQKRLEKACLNAIDKAPTTPATVNEQKSDGSKSEEGNVEVTNKSATTNDNDSNDASSQMETSSEKVNESASKIETSDEQSNSAWTSSEAENEKEPEKSDVTTQEKKIMEISQSEERQSVEDVERPNESGRASVESDESMTSSNVEMLVANAQPDKEGLFFCHLCDFTGNTRIEFQEHMNWHYDFRCPKCDYTSRTEGRLNRHIRDFHSDVPPQNFSGKVTRVNKPKTHKCKQCNYVALTKTDFWAHSRTHIKDDKILECPKCDFVTEYKHHLEYHIRNHFGSKPYKCEKCNYECVNKSMLNSHMKSHTNVYQYRCADCQYATKYCHSLKLHLGKYQHRPATILNSDGSLPEYDNSTDILSIKRGPPRGSRLPRLGSEPNGMSSTSCMDTSPAPSQALPFLPTGPAINNFWPLPTLAHQAGIFSGLGMPPAFMSQGPMGPICTAPNVIPSYLLPNSGPMMDESGVPRLHPKVELPLPMEEPKDGSMELHCNFCEHQADSRDALVKHMLQVHKDENKDLFGASLLSGFAPDNMMMRQEDASVNGLDNGLGADALDLRSKKGAIDGDNALQNFFKRSIAQAIGAPVLPEDEEEGTPAKQKCEESPPPGPGDTPTGRKRPRKSKAFRINDLQQHIQAADAASPADPAKKEGAETMDDDDEASREPESRMNESGDSSALTSIENADRELEALSRTQECHHCNILFRDRTMFEMHMGYHGYGNPFKCNRCGHISQDKVQFFIHLCQMAHS